jgi:hypothetical protein
MVNSKVAYRKIVIALAKHGYRCFEGFVAFIPCIFGLSSNFKPQRRRKYVKVKRLYISIKRNVICHRDKTQLLLYTDSVENKESRITLIWMSLNDEKKKKKEYTLLLGLLSHSFSWGSFGLGVYQSIWSSKLNLPLLFLLAESKYLPPRTVSPSPTNLSVKLNSDTLFCRADRQ